MGGKAVPFPPAQRRVSKFRLPGAGCPFLKGRPCWEPASPQRQGQSPTPQRGRKCAFDGLAVARWNRRRGNDRGAAKRLDLKRRTISAVVGRGSVNFNNQGVYFARTPTQTKSAIKIVGGEQYILGSHAHEHLSVEEGRVPNLHGSISRGGEGDTMDPGQIPPKFKGRPWGSQPAVGPPGNYEQQSKPVLGHQAPNRCARWRESVEAWQFRLCRPKG